jgi:hypothetical protein
VTDLPPAQSPSFNETQQTGATPAAAAGATPGSVSGGRRSAVKTPGICVVCHVAGGTALAQVPVARNQTTLVDCASQWILFHADATAVALYIVLQAGGPQEPRAPQA